ncbi:MAG: hypothetical protein EI684_03305 [Candidatus Viridilinea halotolerans]|uniref:DUF2281 domain-containing protein n=1 Tax=Candidatus Viridilinea halotolerans TaxID=2491704 RepID=A0A426U805_9CHLR|nr:MAG: hypothetical protein EI684_03305 [Candidatus Viridilinea halotolerans]
MTLQEMLIEIPKLTMQEQLLLLESLSHALNTNTSQSAPITQQSSLVEKLYGAFNPTKVILTDEDVDRMRFEAIMEKHS